ncbi:DegT/DnrJ/EryC1/StrS family aminotransferase [bacterium]|nr:DegT/DnrJ/EryC1/StrS family aminotransferase [bacterium]
MNVPLLDLNAQLDPLRDEIKAAVNDVIDSTRYIGGPKITALEEAVADYCGAAYAIGVTSGTDALLVSLMGIGVGHGDIVITTPYSFFATAGVISRLCATPVFVGIDPLTYNLDPTKLSAWFNDNQDKISKVKAIIPVHLYGQCADMDAILAIADSHNIPVIEDAAQAIGSRYPSKAGEKRAGSMGLAGCFSFFPSKNLGCMGDGGMVVTNDKAFADKIQKLRNHGAHPKYYHQMVGGNFRLDAMQAAILLVKLPHLDDWHKGRQQNAAYYDEHLNVEGLLKPHIAYNRESHIYNQYIVKVPGNRDDLRRYLNDAGIGCEVYYPVSFHEQECFKYLGYEVGDFPESEKAANSTIALPIYPELTTEMQDYIIQKIGEFYR